MAADPDEPARQGPPAREDAAVTGQNLAGTAEEPTDTGPGRPAATGVVQALARRGETLAVAESLTGGALAAAVVDVPGASVVLRGGVVAYATDLKHALLGVDEALLVREGAVHPEVAIQMADGVRTRLAASWGLATTGVAGPDPQDGRPPGTVHVALAAACGTTVESLDLAGNRAQVRSAAVAAALELLNRALGSAVQPRA